MGQFTAYVFEEEGRYRVVVDGLGTDSARSLFEAEDVARRLIELHVHASYPERGTPAPADAVGSMNFQLEIVRSDGSRERRELWLRSRRTSLHFEGRRKSRSRQVAARSRSNNH